MQSEIVIHLLLSLRRSKMFVQIYDDINASDQSRDLNRSHLGLTQDMLLGDILQLRYSEKL